MAQRIYFLTLIFSINYTFLASVSVGAEDYKRTVINDPSVNRKCELLLEKRLQKINNKQRTQSLIKRNKYLQSITPENKISLKSRLESNLHRLENELSLLQLQIQYEEENIVRKGCPGITL